MNWAQAVKIIRNGENISYNPHNINNTGENMDVPDDDDIYEEKVELGWLILLSLATRLISYLISAYFGAAESENAATGTCAALWGFYSPYGLEL